MGFGKVRPGLAGRGRVFSYHIINNRRGQARSGAVWRGEARLGMARQRRAGIFFIALSNTGVAGPGAARPGTARPGTAWRSPVWQGKAFTSPIFIRMRPGQEWRGVAVPGTARLGMARSGDARHGTARQGTARHFLYPVLRGYLLAETGAGGRNSRTRPVCNPVKEASNKWLY